MQGIEFHELVRTFQTTEALPQLPDSAIRLVQVCDNEEATLQEAEVVVVSDPGLTAMVIRSASSVRYLSAGGPPTTVSSAVMRLGLRALKALAMTYAFRMLIGQRHDSDCYDAKRLARHSVFTAIATQYLFDREYGNREHDLEEVFTFGLLHDLGVCLFATVAPDLFDECWRRAERTQSTFEATFEAIYSEPLATLGWAGASAWNLPDIFVEFLHTRTHQGEPSDLQQVDSVVQMAEDFAPSFGYAFEPWIEAHPLVGLSESEQEALKEAADQYCLHAFGACHRAA